MLLLMGWRTCGHTISLSRNAMGSHPLITRHESDQCPQEATFRQANAMPLVPVRCKGKPKRLAVQVRVAKPLFLVAPICTLTPVGNSESKFPAPALQRTL